MTDLFAYAVSVAERRWRNAPHGFRTARHREYEAAVLARLRAEIVERARRAKRKAA